MGTVVAYSNEAAEKLIRRAERKSEWARKETRRRKYHEKTTTKRKLQKDAAVKRQKKLTRKDRVASGSPRGKSGK